MQVDAFQAERMAEIQEVFDVVPYFVVVIRLLAVTVPDHVERDGSIFRAMGQQVAVESLEVPARPRYEHHRFVVRRTPRFGIARADSASVNIGQAQRAACDLRPQVHVLSLPTVVWHTSTLDFLVKL